MSTICAAGWSVAAASGSASTTCRPAAAKAARAGCCCPAREPITCSSHPRPVTSTALEILTHELSHLVLGHAPNTALTDAEAAELVDLLLGGLDPRMVAEVLLSRTRYDHPRELETEVLASYLISVPRRRRRQRRGGPSSARLAADHLDAML